MMKYRARKCAPGILEYAVKRIVPLFLAILVALIGSRHANAQGAETIWLSAVNTAYKTGETVLVTVNASSATPVQGFTFQIRYDPECLTPVNASSPIVGMNGLQLPQLTGLVDGSYASTTPQTINGALAEVRFTAARGCETSLYLESAALAIRNAEGFAAPLLSVLVGERNISLFIDKEVVTQVPPPDSGSMLALDPPEPEGGISIGGIAVVTAILIAVGLFGVYRVLRRPS